MLKLSLVLLVGLALAAGAQGATAAQSAAGEKPSSLEVGAASATVNPANGVCLAGYDLNRLCTGVHDDLYAKAVVFYDGKSAVALVVVDSISLQYDTVKEIRTAAVKAIAAMEKPRVVLPPERIIVQATHSHCAPDTIGIYGIDEQHSGRDPAYMKQIIETAAQQVARAVEALQPARLVYAETVCKGWAVNDSEPAILDNSVTILQSLDGHGKSIATLTNFACHPTVLDGDTTLASADWVGAFYKTMAAAMPGQHLFLQGAVGCWMQPDTPERTFTLAERYGKDLAEKTLAALTRTTPIEDTSIRCASKVFGLPNTNEKFNAMGLSGLVPRSFGDAIETEVAWFAVGPAQFATHLGETAPEYSNETKALMDTKPKFVLGLGLDHLGYICPARYFENTDKIKFADYLVSMSPGPAAGPAMMEALKSIIPASAKTK